MKCEYERQMLAAILGQLCDMVCGIEIWTEVKVRSQVFIRKELWVTFERRNRSGVPHLNWLAAVRTMKKTIEIIFTIKH